MQANVGLKMKIVRLIHFGYVLFQQNKFAFFVRVNSEKVLRESGSAVAILTEMGMHFFLRLNRFETNERNYFVAKLEAE